MELNFDNLNKSIKNLEKSLKVSKKKEQDKNVDKDEFETIKSGVIQNYEVCYESCWKAIKRWLEENLEEVDGVTRRALFIKAAECKLIDSVEKWMTFHHARNSTSHTYDEEIADDVYKISFEFLDYAKKLFARVGEK